MLILGLDLARVAGYAIGEAGSVPESGSWVLRNKGDDMHVEPAALARALSRLIVGRRPDLIAVEEPLSAAAKWSKKHGEDGKQYAQSLSLQSQHMLHGALHAWAGVSCIPVVRVASSTARKIVTGRGNLGDRDETKRFVRDRLVMLGLLPRGCTNLDRSDAVCVHAWASIMHGRAAAPLVLA